jgi:hypothetical protein
MKEAIMATLLSILAWKTFQDYKKSYEKPDTVIS